MSPPYVRQAHFEDAIVLLDLRRGEFLMLDEMAAAIWRGLTRQTATGDSLPESLTKQFDVEQDRVSEDIRAFRQQCLADGLLVDSCTQFPVPARRPLRPVIFPTLAAWACLADAARKLRSFGFADAYATLVERAPDVPSVFDENQLVRAEKAFARAENFFVARAAPNDCLPRSMALFSFLRKMGLPAEFCFGVERYSLTAHAWVECGGRVISDADRRTSLTKLSPGVA